MLSGVALPQAGNAIGVCNAVTVVFHGTTLAGIVEVILGITGTTVCATAGALDGGVAGVLQRVTWLA